jgi:replicative DNA helicase
MTPHFIVGNALFNSLFASIERGEPPTRYTLPPPFDKLDVRPGRLILLGGKPGCGKSAALLQIAIDLLRQNTAVRLLMANVEMAPSALAERIVARLSGVPLTAIIDRTLMSYQLEQIRAAVDSIAPVMDRIAFLNAPFALEHVAAAGTAFKANVLILDYLQRFTVGDGKGEKREQLETAATVLRRFCDAGAAVLAASAVARNRSPRGSTYDGLGLASFRGSSELEFGADSVYLLEPGGAGGGVWFRCEKNRFDEMADIMARFDPMIQKFAPLPAGLDGFDIVTPAGESKAKGGS